MHYLAVMKLFALFRGITLKKQWFFYCLNCFHLFRIKIKLISHKEVCKDHGFCDVIMPYEWNKILKYNQYLKSMRVPFLIYADLKSLIKNNQVWNQSKSIIHDKRRRGYCMRMHIIKTFLEKLKKARDIDTKLRR